MALLTQVRIVEDKKEHPVAVKLNPPSVMDQKDGQYLPGMERHRTPLSDHVRNLLYVKMKDLVPRTDQYDKLFDRFEYVLALVVADYADREGSLSWFPVGRFGWRNRHFPERGISAEIAKEIEKAGVNWPLLKFGLCGGSIERLRVVKTLVDERVRGLPWL